jgi:hypothetical protein
MLENVEQRNKETAEKGLVKGETACNRSACQAPLNRYDGLGWWNTETKAYYCPSLQSESIRAQSNLLDMKSASLNQTSG